MPKATIAVIEGGSVAAGASLSRLRHALRRTGAIFNQPEVALGTIPWRHGYRSPAPSDRPQPRPEAILGCDDIDAATAEQEMGQPCPAGRRAGRLRRSPRPPARLLPAPCGRRGQDECRQGGDRRVVEQLLAEAHAFSKTLGDPTTRAAMESFLARGQTPEERRLGALAGEAPGNRAKGLTGASGTDNPLR